MHVMKGLVRDYKKEVERWTFPGHQTWDTFVERNLIISTRWYACKHRLQYQWLSGHVKDNPCHTIQHPEFQPSPGVQDCGISVVFVTRCVQSLANSAAATVSMSTENPMEVSNVSFDFHSSFFGIHCSPDTQTLFREYLTAIPRTEKQSTTIVP